MSAIIAGKACKTCGERDYWASFGHPDWWGTWDQENPIFHEFAKIQSSGNCLKCYIKDVLKDNPFLVWLTSGQG